MIIISIILAIVIIVLWVKLHNTIKVDLETSYYKGWTDCEGLAMSSAMKHSYDTAQVKKHLFSASKVEVWAAKERTK